MRIAFFILFLFALNAFFPVVKSWHTYEYYNSNRCSKWTHNSPKKWLYFAKKNFFLRLYFRDERKLYTKPLFDVLTIYPKCYLFCFFSRDICMQTPILTGVQNRRMNLKKSLFFAKKLFFLKFIF